MSEKEKDLEKGVPGRKNSEQRGLEAGTGLEHLRISCEAWTVRLNQVGKPENHVMEG